MRCGAVWCSFLIIKPQTMRCGAVRSTITSGAVMPFCEWFWCGFCGLCDLVNTPNGSSICGSGLHFFFFSNIFGLLFSICIQI